MPRRGRRCSLSLSLSLREREIRRAWDLAASPTGVGSGRGDCWYGRRPVRGRPLQVVMDFKMPGKVFTAAMSPIATTHMLIATGSADVQMASCPWSGLPQVSGFSGVVAVMGQYVSGTSGELDAFVFLINHSLSSEGDLLFLKTQQRMYVHSTPLLLFALLFAIFLKRI